MVFVRREVLCIGLGLLLLVPATAFAGRGKSSKAASSSKNAASGNAATEAPRQRRDGKQQAGRQQGLTGAATAPAGGAGAGGGRAGTIGTPRPPLPATPPAGQAATPPKRLPNAVAAENGGLPAKPKQGRLDKQDKRQEKRSEKVLAAKAGAETASGGSLGHEMKVERAKQSQRATARTGTALQKEAAVARSAKAIKAAENNERQQERSAKALSRSKSTGDLKSPTQPKPAPPKALGSKSKTAD